MKLFNNLLNTSAEAVNTITQNTNVMTEYHDMIIGIWIMANHNPKHFFELGSGTAGWPVVMHNVLNLEDTKFTLSEDMSWGSTDFVYRGEKYPKDATELTDLVNKKVFSKMNFEILETVDLSSVSKYDTLRVDCDPSFGDFESYIDNCDENSVIFIDDFKFNVSLKRVAYTMSLVARHKLFPLWLGDQESAWTNNQQYRNYLINKSYNQLEQIKTFKVNPRVFNQGVIDGVEWIYINSRGSNDLLFTTHNENRVSK